MEGDVRTGPRTQRRCRYGTMKIYTESNLGTIGLQRKGYDYPGSTNVSERSADGHDADTYLTGTGRRSREG